MTVSRHTSATREQLTSAAAWAGPATNADADRLLESHTGKVEELLTRRFYPRILTRKYDFPSSWQANPLILWLDDDLLSVTEFRSGGVVITDADYFLGPLIQTGDPDKPFDRIELNWMSNTVSFAVGQRILEVEGLWGYSQTEAAAGTLSSNIDADDTTATVAPAGPVGVGDLIRIGTERMIVADRNAMTLTVIRGAYGTTAASHLATAPVYRHVPPGLITDLVIAECIAQRNQEMSGYASTTGPGGQTTPDRIALLDLRKRAMEAYGRTPRTWL